MLNDKKLLSIYLNDHLAGSVAFLELAKRSNNKNAGRPLRDFLSELIDRIRAEQEVLRTIIERAGGRQSVWKGPAMWLGEKLGRLKLNGRLIAYSPLSRVIEIEGLTLGINAKLALWHALETLNDESLVATDMLEDLIASAGWQRQQAEVLLSQAVSEAFSSRPTEPEPDSPSPEDPIETAQTPQQG